MTLPGHEAIEVEQRTHILKRLAGCFTDHRDVRQVEHPLEVLVKQRVLSLALGYEDLNDHDTLRQDPLLALLCDSLDLMGEGRRRGQCDTIRLKLLKIGGLIRASVRRVSIAFSEGYPYAALFGQILRQLQSIPMRC